MSLNNKVVWSEGMFLNPQHFQQQERYLEALIDGKFSSLDAYSWGMREFELDQQMLKLGKVSLLSARGILPDGTPFNFPSIDAAPAVINIPENTQNTIVCLCLPVKRQGALEVVSDENAQSLARFTSIEHEIRDVSTDTGETVPIAVGKLNLRLMLDHDDLSGYVCIGMIRIAEIRDDKTILLDEMYIPPLLDCKHSPRLQGYLTELTGLLHSRAEAIAARLADPNRGGTAEVADYMLLQLLNRFEPLALHMSHIKGLHPVDLYGDMVQMIGELSTFVSKNKRAPVFPGYLHDNLQACFEPLMVSLRNSFSTVHEQQAVALELVEKKYGIRVAELRDRSMIGSSVFILSAKADLPEEQLRVHLPAQIKIGPVERIRQLVNAAMPGIGLKPLPVAPRQIPFHSGFCYFQLEPKSEFWNELKHSGGFAIHVGGDFPGLTFEFWAIRQS